MVFIMRFLIPAACLWFLWRYFQQETKPLDGSSKRPNSASDSEVVDLCPDCGEVLKEHKNHKCI